MQLTIEQNASSAPKGDRLLFAYQFQCPPSVDATDILRVDLD